MKHILKICIIALMLITCWFVVKEKAVSIKHNGAYIQYMDERFGTATEIYDPNGNRIYEFGEVTAWRDVDQRIHAWDNNGGNGIVLDNNGDVIEDPVYDEVSEQRKQGSKRHAPSGETIISVTVGNDNPYRYLVCFTEYIPEQDERGVENQPLTTSGFNWATGYTEKKEYCLLDEYGYPLSEIRIDGYSRCGFCDGLLLIEKDGLMGYMNLQGDIVIPAMFSNCTDFYSGKAVVYIGEENETWIEGFYIIDIKGNMVHIDNTSPCDFIPTAIKNIAEYYGIARGYRCGIY